MANNIDKKEPVTNCEQSKIDIIKCDNHELAGNIEPLIKVIRGQQVMLDKDLAMLYGVEAKVLNQAVKRNVERFPNDFRFQLTKEECLRTAEQMKAKYREVISLLRKGYSIRNVAKLCGKGVSTVQRVKRLLKVQSSQ